LPISDVLSSVDHSRSAFTPTSTRNCLKTAVSVVCVCVCVCVCSVCCAVDQWKCTSMYQ